MILGLFERRSDRLGGGLNVRYEKEGSRMILRLLAQESCKMDFPFTKSEKTAKEMDLGNMGGDRFR